jgi:hypothetical protein
MPLTDEQRRRNEASIRAAMDRLLRGELPPQGRCDIKTLAREAGVARTGFYPRPDPTGQPKPGPYQHLAEEFHRRLRALHDAGTIPDPHEDQITRLKAENTTLRDRVSARDREIAELTAFNNRALSQLAAQHDEITRLRQQMQTPGNVRKLTISLGSRITGPCS